MNRRQVMIATAASILGFPFAKATASNPDYVTAEEAPQVLWRMFHNRVLTDGAINFQPTSITAKWLSKNLVTVSVRAKQYKIGEKAVEVGAAVDVVGDVSADDILAKLNLMTWKPRWDVFGRMLAMLRGMVESKCEEAGASAIRNVSVGLWENDSRFYISVCGHLVDQNEHKVSLSEFSLDCPIRYMAGWRPYAGQIRAAVRAKLSNS